MYSEELSLDLFRNFPKAAGGMVDGDVLTDC